MPAVDASLSPQLGMPLADTRAGAAISAVGVCSNCCSFICGRAQHRAQVQQIMSLSRHAGAGVLFCVSESW